MQKMKKVFLFFFLVLFFSTSWAADSKVPKDLSVEYEFIQGGPEKAATREYYSVKEGKLTLKTDYIPTQYGSDLSKRTQEVKSYNVPPEDLQNLWNIIVEQQFMTWPQANASRPDQAGNQSFTIKANGKTVTHTMWEAPNKDRFTEFSRQFLQWAKRKMTIEF